MIENKEKPIVGLKVKYDGKIYENIVYFNISNWDGQERVNFSIRNDDNVTININCSFKDIKIIQSSDN